MRMTGKSSQYPCREGASAMGWKVTGLVCLIMLTLAASESECETEPTSKSELPTATPRPAEDATPTAEQALREFTQCQKLKANKSLTWGQASGVIYSGNPSVTGQIEQGDYVRILTNPNAEGNLRIEVYPHDDRAVGKTDNRVWINWTELTRFRSDQFMFTCEE